MSKQKSINLKITDKLEERFSDEKKQWSPRINNVNERVKNQMDQGTLDSICCFKAFYSLAVFSKN